MIILDEHWGKCHCPVPNVVMGTNGTGCVVCGGYL